MSSNITSPSTRFPNTNLFHGGHPLYSEQNPLHTSVLSDKVNTWVISAAASSIRLRNLLNNGLYSLLNKEIVVATRCLEDSVALEDPRDVTVQRYLKDLPTLVQHAKQVCLREGKNIKKDAKLEEKWSKLGLPPSILESHADCARFLVETSLIYSIVGYRETSQNPAMHGVRIDERGHPLIKVQGQWTRWADIKDRLHFDENDKEIFSNEPDGRIQKWNYFHEQGLVPLDRFNYDQVYPIYRLSEEEYDRLKVHAARFYETRPQRDISIPKDCIVQFFTTPRAQGLGQSWYSANFHRQIPVHVGIRLITSDRQVYSFGFQMPESEQRKVNSDFNFGKMLSTYLMTGTASISMLDYEEFRPYADGVRKVTSIPLTAARAERILGRLNQLNGQDQLRFQFGRQNCTSLMLEVIQDAGYDDVDVRTPGWQVLTGMIPNANQIPVIGLLIGKVESVASRIWNAIVNVTPQCIRTLFSAADTIIFYVPRKIRTVFTNLLMLKLGANKFTCPLADTLVEERPYHKKRIQNFSSVISSWTDLLTDETAFVNHSKGFLDFQNEVASTYTYQYPGRPKLCIVPPEVPIVHN